MLFLGYYELTENLSPNDIAEVAAEVMEKGLFPPEGVKLLGFYTTTDVPIWGFAIFEAESVEQVLKVSLAWRMAKPNFFKVLRVSPGTTPQEATRVILEM